MVPEESGLEPSPNSTSWAAAKELSFVLYTIPWVDSKQRGGPYLK